MPECGFVWTDQIYINVLPAVVFRTSCICLKIWGCMWKKKGYWIKILTLAIILYVFKHKSLMDTITLCTVYGS